MDLKPKTKMVSFRLSPDEYLLYREACKVHGVRNISELARTALHDRIETASASRDEQVRELRERVKRLAADIERYAGQHPMNQEAAAAAAENGR